MFHSYLSPLWSLWMLQILYKLTKTVKELRVKTAENNQVEWVYDIQRQLVLLTIFVVMNNHTICYGKQQVKRAISLLIANGHFCSSPSACGEVHVLLNTLASITSKGHQSRSVKIINNMIRITSPCYNKK